MHVHSATEVAPSWARELGAHGTQTAASFVRSSKGTLRLAYELTLQLKGVPALHHANEQWRCAERVLGEEPPNDSLPGPTRSGRKASSPP